MVLPAAVAWCLAAVLVCAGADVGWDACVAGGPATLHWARSRHRHNHNHNHSHSHSHSILHSHAAHSCAAPPAGLKVALDQGVDVAVLEVGLGGRLDATNVVPQPVVCGITSLGFDHMEILGHTLPQIAREKAGIMKAGSPAFTVPQPEDAMQALQVGAAGTALWCWRGECCTAACTRRGQLYPWQGGQVLAQPCVRLRRG
jgi:hypothetical protein